MGRVRTRFDILMRGRFRLKIELPAPLTVGVDYGFRPGTNVSTKYKGKLARRSPVGFTHRRAEPGSALREARRAGRTMGHPQERQFRR
jgi:hypothetical protein